MTRFSLLLAASLALAAPLVLVLSCRSAAADPPPARRESRAGAGPVLVELYTSQGCSSCPPADRLLTGLPRAAAARGIQVLPLSFHVDYWDDLGWRDQFSSRAFTERQERYARALARGRIYTPELVVAGTQHMVGSNRRAIDAALAHAVSQARTAPAPILRARAVRAGSQVVVTVDARAASRASGPVDVWVALHESDLITRVQRGENQGRTLRNDFVVRRIARAFRLAPGKARTGRVTLPLSADWRPDHLGVTVFAQDPATLAVPAAAAAYWRSSSSTSNSKVAPGGMTPPAPRAP